MRVYSYSEARQQLAKLLNRARREGQVEIRRRDGQSFVVRPTKVAGSPLDVPGVDAGLSREDVIDLVRESRESTGRLLKRKGAHGQPAQPTRSNRGKLSPLLAGYREMAADREREAEAQEWSEGLITDANRHEG
jgi:prevent-host-death family protein